MKKLIAISALLFYTSLANASYEVVINPVSHLNKGDIVFINGVSQTEPVPPVVVPPVEPAKPAGYECDTYSESKTWAKVFRNNINYGNSIRYLRWQNRIYIDSGYTNKLTFPVKAEGYMYVAGDLMRSDSGYDYYQVCRYPIQ